MKRFDEELKKVLFDEERKIEDIQNNIKEKKRAFAKDFFKVGVEVEYSDRDGVMRGSIIGVDDEMNVAVMLNYCNGQMEKRELHIFKADKLSLI